MKKEKNKKIKGELSEKDIERLELLQKIHEKTGKQLRVDGSTGNLEEINELREMLAKRTNPEETYNTYYKGLRKFLMNHLPKGPEFKEARQIIYDEKNVFLNRGKKKSDNNGIRGSDGRMAFIETMNEMLTVVTTWATESENPIDLYNMLYDLNDRYGYGHELYDSTSINYQKAASKK